MKGNRFLIVVDMQNDFITGSLGTQEAAAIVPAAAERIRACWEAGVEILATLDTHEEDYLDTAEGKKLPVSHCIRGCRAWELAPEIAMALGKDYTPVEKPTFGVRNGYFTEAEEPEIIREMAGNAEDLSIELLGLCTDICVVSNALLLKAHFPEARISVNAACCAGVTPETHRAALKTMGCCQIDILE